MWEWRTHWGQSPTAKNVPHSGRRVDHTCFPGPLLNKQLVRANFHPFLYAAPCLAGFPRHPPTAVMIIKVQLKICLYVKAFLDIFPTSTPPATSSPNPHQLSSIVWWLWNQMSMALQWFANALRAFGTFGILIGILMLLSLGFFIQRKETTFSRVLFCTFNEIIHRMNNSRSLAYRYLYYLVKTTTQDNITIIKGTQNASAVQRKKRFCHPGMIWKSKWLRGH